MFIMENNKNIKKKKLYFSEQNFFCVFCIFCLVLFLNEDTLGKIT